MYRERRKRLLEKLPDYSLCLVYSGLAPYKIGDEKYPFSVNPNFYYLTGIDRENMALLLFKLPNNNLETLFIERFDELMAKWVGAKMLVDEASKISEVANVSYIDELNEEIGTYLNRYNSQQIVYYADFDKQEYSQLNGSVEKYANKLQNKYPWLQIRNLTPLITELRLVKSSVEIENLKKGIEVTRLGIEAMLRHVKEGMNEAEVEAAFQFEVIKNQCENSFDSIVASGINATTLHYSSNNSVIKPNKLVLTDLGARYHKYCADITRTFPAKGKFTARQKEIYEIVLAANKHIIEFAKVGMTLRDLQNELIKFYEPLLAKASLTKPLSEYYFHGVSHMLGIECHDASLLNYPLQVGNVFTVEPGLYIEDEAIGIRIEDNVVMRENGVEVLSSSIIKEVKDIEAYMEKYNK